MKGFLGNFPVTLLCAHGEHIQLCDTCFAERFDKAMTVCPDGGSLAACRLCNEDEKYAGDTYDGECTRVDEKKMLEKK